MSTSPEDSQVSAATPQATRLSPEAGGKRRLNLILGVGLLLIAALGGLLLWLRAPADGYQFTSPPAGPNARPDPPNAEKLKILPKAAPPR
jgi:hypothetical protein